MSRRARRFDVLSRAARCEALERRVHLSISPAGGEFRVNATLGNVHDSVAIAADGDGAFVAVWESFGQDGSFDGIFGRRFNPSGVPQGGEFQVNTYTTGNQTLPAVAMDADGDFVVAWSSAAQDGSLEGIFAQRYNALGVAQGIEFRVNTFTTNVQASPSVAMDAAGNFVIAWHSVNQESASNVGIYAQRYDFEGVRQGGEFRVNSSTPSPQFTPAVAMNAAGDFVVAWDSGGQDGSGYGVYARRFDRAGVAQGSEFPVNTFTTGLQAGATVGMGFGGEFVIAWHSQGQDGSLNGVYAQRFDAAGAAQGGEFRINTFTTGGQLLPKVAVDADGDFLVTWISEGQDGSGSGVYAQQYGKTGAPIGGEFRVNSTTSGEQLSPRVAVDHKGDFIIGWHGNGADDFQSIYAQRYTESVDTASPIVTGVFARERRVRPYSTQAAPISQIIVGFSENMSDAGGATGTNSVTNPANWLITRNGVNVAPTISYGFNVARGRFEAVVNLPGSFTSGNFIVKPRDNLRDIAGNRLDGNLDGAAGGVMPLPFSVASVGPAGGEFKVNTFVGGAQGSAAVAMDAAGAFAVVWTSDAQDGDNSGIYAQRYNAAGTAQGGEFKVNTFTTSAQSSPAIAMDSAGNFVVAWQSFTQDGSGNGVYAQRYNAAGAAQGGEFRVNTFVTGHQEATAVAIDAAGNFVVVWQSVQDGNGFGIYAQRYSAAGMAQGGEFQVNAFTTGNQWRPSVAMDASGNFTVAWHSDDQDGSSYGVYARRYNAAGAAQGGEFRVNTVTDGGQAMPSIAMNPTGDFAVAWQTPQDGSGLAIYAQRFNAAGVAQGDEFQVNTFTTGHQRNPGVAIDAAGNFAVTWESPAQDGDGAGIFARRYDAAGVAQTGEFPVNTFTTNSQASPTVAMDATGNFVVAWQSSGQSGSASRIYAQRYGVRSTPVVSTLTDTPDPVTSGNSITLTASGVTADGGAVTSVSFYRETNNEPGLQVGLEGDMLVGIASTNVGGFWSVSVPTGGLVNGTYVYWAQATDDSGLTGAPASTTNNVIGGAPAVTASSFLFNTAPHRLQFTFSDNVSASLGTDDIVLQNLTTMSTIPANGLSVSYDPGTNRATFSYVGNAGGITGILPDGSYRATLLAAGITNAGGTPMPANHVFDFFFLNGDANRDGVVNLQDFNRLAANFGQSGPGIDFTRGDFNYDGVVNLADFNILAARFGTISGPQRDQSMPLVVFGQMAVASAPYSPDERRLTSPLDDSLS